jgi:ketosteroid isomerase-like protein
MSRYLTMITHADDYTLMRGEVGGLPDQDWSLRVTQVYRREGSEWRLVHRHADPLVNGISVEQAAAIARG